MRELIFVAAGGSIGAVTRYGAGLAAARWLGRGFPWGTLAVNVAGCFLMGLVMEIMLNLEAKASLPPPASTDFGSSFWRQGVAIGFLGALTTFSAFGADTIRQLQSGQHLTALANIAANVTLSLAAVWCGVILIRAIN